MEQKEKITKVNRSKPSPFALPGMGVWGSISRIGREKAAREPFPHVHRSSIFWENCRFFLILRIGRHLV
jgi:hypothetical protein